MATAGSGDVLTGVILALLGQGYAPEQAAMLGVYMHGAAGDAAAAQTSQRFITATDIIERLYVL
jgi:NAD(P)H-hydrate epimerase